MIPALIALALGAAFLAAGWYAIRAAADPRLAYLGAALFVIGLAPAGVGAFALARLIF